jgi:hypothetical protein
VTAGRAVRAGREVSPLTYWGRVCWARVPAHLALAAATRCRALPTRLRLALLDGALRWAARFDPGDR